MTKKHKDKKLSGMATETFKPEVGWLVSNVNCSVFLDPVVEVNADGFICKSTGRWTGAMEGWIAHNNITPREED